ncbi:Transposon TX1 uncharacterized 149 kDa protein [Linum perenne]
MISLLSWNCRGAGHNSFVSVFKHYLQVYKPSLVAILEPRISGRRGLEVRSKLGLQFSIIEEARGFRGGIWLLWDDPLIKVCRLSHSEQFIHVEVEADDKGHFLLTLAYASPILLRRRVLWQDLLCLSRHCTRPWLLAGDFNAMVDSSEKVGGARFNSAKAQEFREWIANCGLFDAGFTGPKFTWFRGNIRERLDRSLCNDKWLELFPTSATFHVERLKSDHRPILIRSSDEAAQVRPIRPFRFNAAWLSHDDFKPMLDRSWQARKDLCVSLQVLAEDCKKWNADVFGNIFVRKRTLSNRLRWLESKNARVSNPRFVAEELEVRTELEKTLWQEEMLWLQKARVQWTLDGDKNTRFFHLSTLRRRSINRIKGLKDQNGQWIYDKERLSEIAIDHFQALFTAGGTSPLQASDAAFDTPLTTSESMALGRDLSMVEITSAIKSMGRLKAPGKDGFQPIFFQNCWNTIGSDVSDYLFSCFRSPELIEKANQTIIVLIPKLLKPDQISQFRPISLCNVSYKTLAKCVADRLRSRMSKLVNETQTSFVPGRHITDNIIILQEVVHSMRSKSGKKGWMTIKLDLANAFDRLEWSFVEDTLRKAGFPDNLIKIIICCISTTSTQILWNGGLTSSFKPGRGLR